MIDRRESPGSQQRRRTARLAFAVLVATALVACGGACSAASTDPKTDTGDGGGSHARADTVFYDGFESGTFAGWPDGYDPSKHQIVSDASGAQSGSRYLDVTYPAGQSGGSLNHFFMPGYDSVYVRYYVRFEPTWQGLTKLLALYGSQTTDQWSALGKAGVCPTGSDFFSAMLVTATTAGDPPPVRFYTYYPAMHREPDGVTCYGSAGDGTEHYVDPNTAMSRGVWHKIEYWVKLNAVGQANSVQRFWIDGVLRGEWSGIVIRTSDILRLNVVQLAFSACCGGAPKTQHLQVDEVLVLRAMPR